MSWQDEYLRWQSREGEQPRATTQGNTQQTRASRAGAWARDRASQMGQKAKERAVAAGTRAKTAGGAAFRSPSRAVRWGAPIWEGAELTEDLMRGAPESATRGNIARGVESGGRLAATLGGAKVGGGIGAAGGTLFGGPVLGAIGGLGGAIAGGVTGYTGYNRAARAGFGGELPSEEWARMRQEGGLPANMIRPMGQTLDRAVEEARDFYNTSSAPRTPEEAKTPSATRTPQTIYRGTQDGQTMFSNVPFEGGVAEPDFEQRLGTLNVVPSSFFTNKGPTPQANVDAIRAAAARGDWDALERVGAIGPGRGSSRGVGGGGGGGGGMDMPDQFAQAEALQAQAQRLYQQAARTPAGAARSPIIREADMLARMAEATLASGTSLATTAMGQAGAGDGMAVDPKTASEIMKNLAQAGLYEADAFSKLHQTGVVDPRLLTALDQVPGGEQLLRQIISQQSRNAFIDQLAAMGYDPNYVNTISQEEFDALQGTAKELFANARPDLAQAEEKGGIRGWYERTFADGGFVDDPDMVMNFADGGYVPEMSAMGGYGMEDTLGPMGAMDMAGGIGMPDPLQVEYSQYMQGAEQLGLPAIPFEQFVQLKQMSIPQAPEAPGMEQPMGMMGFADGGMVDSPFQSRQSVIAMARGGGVNVDGKMVVDPNPNAPTDSIPAMIDGKQPAALDSGEFVIPKHAVMFHGVDKLNKLIAQAEKGPADGAIA